MRWLACVVLFTIGCSTQKQTGEALVIGGTTAIVAATRSGQMVCYEEGCAAIGTGPSKAGAVIAGAGAGAVVAGYVLQETAQGDVVSKPDPDPPQVVPATYELPKREPSQLPPVEEAEETEATEATE
jgi:hypothetical protein